MARPLPGAAARAAPAPPPAAPARAAARAGRRGVLRLFVAVWPPAEVAAHLARTLGRPASDRWHVTLAFLGEVPDPDPVVERLRTVPVPPVEARLRGAGTFSGGRVLWVGVDGLDPLAASVQRALQVDDDRPFRGHLTVARGRGLSAEGLKDYAGPAWTVDRIALVRSAGGYTDLWSSAQ